MGRVIRLLFDPRQIEGRGFEVCLCGFRYRGWTRHFIDWNILFYGAYEEDDLLVLRTLANTVQPSVFLDVGANVGEYSILMSEACQRVIAFEPNPALHEQLLDNAGANNLDNVELQPFALGRTNESAKLHLGEDSGESSLLSSANRNDPTNTTAAETRRGDNLLKELSANSGVGIIKIDVEGYEFHVLQGLADTIANNRPFIMLEMSPGGREQFGTVHDFSAAFPNAYAFYWWRKRYGIRRSQQLFSAAVDDVFSGYGNIYAVPEEKRGVFERALARRPRRLPHRRIFSVKLLS